jgi:hypothetical protein
MVDGEKKVFSVELKDVEQRISEVFDNCPSRNFTSSDLDYLSSLKHCKGKLLEIEEASWRLRSYAIWLDKGDKNTVFS